VDPDSGQDRYKCLGRVDSDYERRKMRTGTIQLIVAIPRIPGLRFAANIVILSLLGCGQDVGDNNKGTKPQVQTQRNEEPYLSRRASFKTLLVKKGPSPQHWADDPRPSGVSSVDYESGGRKLKAWLFVPALAGDEKRPALIYLHGGFAFGAEDFTDCLPFTEIGGESIHQQGRRRTTR